MRREKELARIEAEERMAAAATSAVEDDHAVSLRSVRGSRTSTQKNKKES